MGSAMAVPPYTPVSKLTRVMPNWTVENILFGFSRNLMTIFADPFPSSARDSNRAWLQLTMDISSIENIPLPIISKRITRNCCPSEKSKLYDSSF